MPAFGDKISEAQVQSLVVYIRTFGPAAAQKAELSGDVAKQWRQLQEQLKQLQKQFHDLSPTQRKP